MASIIRDAVDAYLEPEAIDLDLAAEQTFGAARDFDVPDRSEWAGRDRRNRLG